MRIHKSLPLALAASSILISPAVLAQDAQDDDVILITAARVPIPADDATASITRMDAADIQARGSVFAADILRAVPGLAVSHSGAPGALTQIRARGAEANHVLVLIDGVEAKRGRGVVHMIRHPFALEGYKMHILYTSFGRFRRPVSRGKSLMGEHALASGGWVRPILKGFPVSPRCFQTCGARDADDCRL